MKRHMLFSILILIFLIVSPVSAEEKFSSKVSNLDTFLTDYAEDAVSLDKSETFDIQFRVLDLNPASDRGERYWLIRYELVMTNQTSNKLNDLQFTVHFDEQMQKVLANSIWYNEPITLGTPSATDCARGAIYEWEALVDLQSVSVEGSVSLDDFYHIMLDVTWKGGREILYVTSDSQALAAQNELFAPIPDGCSVLDEDAIARINEAAK